MLIPGGWGGWYLVHCKFSLNREDLELEDGQPWAASLYDRAYARVFVSELVGIKTVALCICTAILVSPERIGEQS